jgi:hypothetical protein
MRLENYPCFDLIYKDSTAIGAQWKEESSIHHFMHKLVIFIQNLMDLCRTFEKLSITELLPIKKRNNFVEDFFSIRSLFRRENSI